MDKVNYLIIHCSASRPSQDIGRAEIDRLHRAQGWLKIGYHFVIRRNGQIETGRSLSETGAHCADRNKDSLGLCLVGGVREDNPQIAEDNFTPKQWAALETLVRDLLTKYTQAQVAGHYQFASKACPSFNVQNWWDRVIKGRPPKTSTPDPRFDEWLATLLGQEGGYSNVRGDRGGETYAGITRRFWPDWPGWPIVDQHKPLKRFQRIKDSPELSSHLADFYRQHYWDSFRHLADWPPVRMKVANMAVNLGHLPAGRLFQAALNEFTGARLATDGVVGKETLKVMATIGDIAGLIKTICQFQAEAYRNKAKGDDSQQQFLEGWLKRAAYNPF